VAAVDTGATPFAVIGKDGIELINTEDGCQRLIARYIAASVVYRRNASWHQRSTIKVLAAFGSALLMQDRTVCRFSSCTQLNMTNKLNPERYRR
jgi:hypothetical protein